LSMLKWRVDRADIDTFSELGHTRKGCTEEQREVEKVNIICSNCNEEGHRVRDCPAERKTRGGAKTCKNCGQEGHIAKDCDQERSAENVECKNCGESKSSPSRCCFEHWLNFLVGHFSRQCPSKAPDLCRNCGQEGHRKADCENERVMQCRNCDEWGHSGKECPKPRDWSRVKCNNCQQMGHTVVKCTNQPAEVPEESTGGGRGDWDNGGAANGGGASGGWNDGDAANGGGADNSGW
jgi:hypothetical protein